GEDGGDWRVGIRDPSNPDSEITQVLLRDQALSSSAALGPNDQASDLIHPLSGKALAQQRACVVVADTAAVAEMFSTAVVSMGKTLAAAFPHKEALKVGWIEIAETNP